MDTLYFWDGKRKIDLILAFEDPGSGDDDVEKESRRNIFLRNLEAQGLHLELESSRVILFLVELAYLIIY